VVVVGFFGRCFVVIFFLFVFVCFFSLVVYSIFFVLFFDSFLFPCGVRGKKGASCGCTTSLCW